jgi:O-antigen/teichoic acid export membrane protein
MMTEPLKEKNLIARGVIVTYLHLGVAFLSVLLLTPYILGHVGIAGYGLWAVFSSITSYFVLFDLGLNTAVAKYAAECRALGDRKRLSVLISTVLVLFIFLAMLVIAASSGLALFIPAIFHVPAEFVRDSREAFFMMGGNAALTLIAGVFGNMLYGFERVDLWKLGATVQLLTNGIFAVCFLRLGYGLRGLAAASLLGTCAALFMYGTCLRRHHFRVPINFTLATYSALREVAPFSLRTLFLGLSSRILYYTDSLVIGVSLGAGMVSAYDIANKLCFYLTYPTSVIATTLFPHFASLYAKRNRDGLRDAYFRTAKISLSMMTPICIFLAFWGRTLLGIWVGPQNVVSAAVFAVFVFMNIIHAIGTPSGLLLQSVGQNRGFVYSEIINAVLNLTLALILVRKLGLVGVAISTPLAHLCTSSWFVLRQACKHTGLRVKTYLLFGVLPSIVAGIATALLMWLLLPTLSPADNLSALSLNAFVVAILYTVFYLIMVPKEDRDVYLRLLRRRVS